MAKTKTPATNHAPRAAASAGTAAYSSPARQPGALYETIAVDVRESVALVVLSRPDVHNAFNAVLIAELTRALRALDGNPSIRAVVLLGEGKSFCAGADLNWMTEMARYGIAENLADANALATMLKTLYRLSKPTIARVHGAAFGGGAGLVACCDIAFAAQDATFSFSEAKLGLIPATIGPYVVEAIGARHARRYFLSAERFAAAEALRIGLVHEIYPLEELDARINEVLASLLLAGPRAQDEAKALIRAVRPGPIDDAMVADTAARIAGVRGSEEGKEGVAAFLRKRSPAWVPQSLRKK
ncbi:MAG TPA: enoyl-CoA hydratase/isomerase family protein [Casimicrobiaceae bacterium]|nr:enoyl-CoA hydratase/isomerase family protein [Casimicrobiaceae bacterium]